LDASLIMFPLVQRLLDRRRRPTMLQSAVNKMSELLPGSNKE